MILNAYFRNNIVGFIHCLDTLVTINYKFLVKLIFLKIVAYIHTTMLPDITNKLVHPYLVSTSNPSVNLSVNPSVNPRVTRPSLV